MEKQTKKRRVVRKRNTHIEEDLVLSCIWPPKTASDAENQMQTKTELRSQAPPLPLPRVGFKVMSTSATEKPFRRGHEADPFPVTMGRLKCRPPKGPTRIGRWPIDGPKLSWVIRKVIWSMPHNVTWHVQEIIRQEGLAKEIEITSQDPNSVTKFWRC